MDVFDEKGEQLGLYDICRWWIETYPEDIFVKEPAVVCRIRDDMKKILEMRK